MNCPLCTSTESQLFHDNVWGYEGGRVYRCGNCDVTYLHPFMNEKEEKEFYANYNIHVKKRTSAITTDPAEFHTKSMPAAGERYKKISAYFEKGRRVLEVGSSTGAFLELLSSCECHGVEPAHDNREYSKKFCKKTYADIREISENQKFDVICLFHTFEHLRDPHGFLRICRSLLQGPDGTIIIEVPNIDDPLISIYNSSAYKDFYFQPMHPFIYSRKSLNFVFENSGYTTHDFVYYQRYGFDNHINWLINGTPGGSAAVREMIGEFDEYKMKLEKIKKTDTIFYIGGM